MNINDNNAKHLLICLGVVLSLFSIGIFLDFYNFLTETHLIYIVYVCILLLFLYGLSKIIPFPTVFNHIYDFLHRKDILFHELNDLQNSLQQKDEFIHSQEKEFQQKHVQLERSIHEKNEFIHSQEKGFQQKYVELENTFIKKDLLNRIDLYPYLDFSDFGLDIVKQAFFSNIEKYYQLFTDTRVICFSDEWFHFFKYNCLSSQYSFSTEALESLLLEYEIKFAAQKDLCFITDMEGHSFEYWCADLLRNCGYQNVEVTKGSGDQGVDIIAEKDDLRYAIQCKRYASKLSNKPIQEIYAGKSLYNCDVGVVMTNSHFTSGAVELASATGTLLWDIDEIKHMINTISLT